MTPYIETTEGLSIVLRGQPVALSTDDKYYSSVLHALREGASEQAILDIIDTPGRAVRKAVRLSVNMTYEHGTVRYRDEVLHNYGVTKLVQLLEAGYEAEPLINFMERLQLNPSNRVVSVLYEFLEKGGIPLTPDGHFVAYKAIRKDWKDIHSGTFDNSLGKTVQVPRNRVDEDQDKTCSHGLHVCSFDYLPHFAHADGHVVSCKIDPADVVAIPRDYNNTKMRVCKYVVMEELTDYYKKNEDILRSEVIWGGDPMDDTPDEIAAAAANKFRVVFYGEDGAPRGADDQFEYEFDTKGEAIDAAEESADGEDHAFTVLDDEGNSVYSADL